MSNGKKLKVGFSKELNRCQCIWYHSSYTGDHNLVFDANTIFHENDRVNIKVDYDYTTYTQIYIVKTPDGHHGEKYQRKFAWHSSEPVETRDHDCHLVSVW